MDACQAPLRRLPLDDFIDAVKAKFAETDTPRPEEIKDLMEQYIEGGHNDWREFALFNKIKYARNLIEINENFELIILCWLPGQESPVHNHSGQNCWMAVLEGEMQEVYYNLDCPGTESSRCELSEGSVQVYKQGGVAYISDEVALHKVCPVQGAGCTIHLYSKPIPLCNLYCPETGKVTKRKLGFFSRRGHKLPEGDPSSACYLELKNQLCHSDSSCSDSYKKLLHQLDS